MKNSCVRSFRFAFSLIFITLIGVLQTVWAQSPEHPQSFNISPLQKGEFLLLGKKPGEALEVFHNLWREEPENNYAVRGIVRSYQALDKLSEGVSFLNEYLEKHSQSSSATYGLGYIFYLQGKLEKSRKVLGEALKFDPNNAMALNNLAAVLMELKDYPGALKRVKEAININPNELMFYRNLRFIYNASAKPDMFESEYRQFLEEGNLEKAKGYGFILAQELRQMSFRLYVDGKIDKTIKKIGDMLEIYRQLNHQPGIVAGLFSLGTLYEEQGEGELALKKYREVLKINPQHIQARGKIPSLEPKKD